MKWLTPIVLLVTLAACTMPGRAAAPLASAPYILVANAADRTISRLDAASGRALGPPLAIGVAPWQLVSGRGDRLLVLEAGVGVGSGLTFLAPSDHGRLGDNQYTVSPVDLGPNMRAALIAGDGRSYAAVLYSPASGPNLLACRLAVVDLQSGRVVGSQALCKTGDSVHGLGVGADPADPDDPIVYVSLWNESPPPGAGRVVAIDGLSGAVMASAPLRAVPGSLAVAPVQSANGGRVYVATTATGSIGDGCHNENVSCYYAEAGRWQLVALDGLSLTPMHTIALSFAPYFLQVTPDGAAVLAFDAMSSADTHLTRVSLASGNASVLATVPWALAAPAVVGHRVYVPVQWRDEVLVLDAERGSLIRTVKVGHRPIGSAAANAT